jgi:hypothetical protein
MKLTPMVISSFAKFTVGSATFKEAVNLVSLYDKDNLSGEQKRTEVYRVLKGFAGNLATWLLNLAIELAVAWVRAQADKTGA